MNEARELILVKLGGSVITDKTTVEKANDPKIAQLASEIHQAREKDPNLRLVIGHGAGSFGHPQAKEYGTAMGLRDGDGTIGLARIRQAGLKLHHMVLDALLSLDEPAVGVPPFAFMWSSSTVIAEANLEPLRIMLEKGLLPITHGDVILDQTQGCRIVSGETVLNEIATYRRKLGFSTAKMIEIADTPGVFDQSGAVLAEINPKNFHSISEALKASNTIDVTGGMRHKVEEAFALARLGVPTLITSAKPGNLQEALAGRATFGTWIRG